MCYRVNGETMKQIGNIACSICLGETEEIYFNCVLCEKCGSISVKELPSLGELKKYYEKFNEEFLGGGRKRGAKLRQMNHANSFLRRVAKMKKNGRLIDVGSSPIIEGLLSNNLLTASLIRSDFVA